MSKYQLKKEETRQKALEWRRKHYGGEYKHLFSDVLDSFRVELMAKKYGLVKEFRASGVLTRKEDNNNETTV